jgi:hypothetical protein
VRWSPALAGVIAAALACTIALRANPSANVTILIASVSFGAVAIGDLLFSLKEDYIATDRWQLFSRVGGAGAALGASCAAAFKADLSPALAAIAIGAGFNAWVRVTTSEYETYFARLTDPSDDRAEFERETLARHCVLARRWALTAAGFAVVGVAVLPFYFSVTDDFLTRAVIVVSFGFAPIPLAALVAEYDLTARGISQRQPARPGQLRLNLNREFYSPQERKRLEDLKVSFSLSGCHTVLSPLFVILAAWLLASLGLPYSDRALFWTAAIALGIFSMILVTSLVVEPLLRWSAREEILDSESESF